MAQGNKLHKIKPLIQRWASSFQPDRRWEVILARLRIGHTLITHGHLMEKEQAPICEECWTPVSVEHILVECPNYRRERNRFFPHLRRYPNNQQLKSILAEGEHFNCQAIEEFLQESNLDDLL
jgi:hypothetical protein